MNYKYVCCIQSILDYDDDDEEFDEDSSPTLKVMVLKRVDDNSTIFSPDDTDNFVVLKNQIVGVLPDPIMIEKDRKFLYEFPRSVAVFEQA